MPNKTPCYDCIIAGAGPAGIFAAIELLSVNPRLKVLIIEKGKDIGHRERRELFSGWGGAGAYSDGKLTLSSEVGGFLNEYLPAGELKDLIAYTDGLYLKFGAASEIKGLDEASVAGLEKSAAMAGLRLIPFPIRHIGTDRCMELLKNLRAWLEGKADIIFNKEVAGVTVKDGAASGVKTEDGAEYQGGFVILSPGRSGSKWLQGQAEKLSLDTSINPVDIGVRVEVPATVLRPVTDILHEAKLVFKSKRFDDPVRTFCMNPYGVVVKERHAGFCTVNGHSFSTRRSDNTNFAILVSTTFTEPFHEPVEYGEYIARLANLLGNGIIVQRLGDLQHGRRSTPERIEKGDLKPTLNDATPGDLSFVLPYRYITDIVEMLDALDRFAPGINSPSTLLYGVEVKFYSVRLKLTNALETGIRNLFAVGDGAGVTRGIIQASASGVVAAREILRRV
ncbi:MAG: NAD(P)/FAD-dependent oxidoreductase [Deltaproteobacteria bacterium]|nr:NAD(P)/FAD-dependent oxidoreductase [Deltaproteobacteria bacterium]